MMVYSQKLIDEIRKSEITQRARETRREERNGQEDTRVCMYGIWGSEGWAKWTYIEINKRDLTTKFFF